MSYYFNADFETCILEERPFNPQLKMNREFEYFIMLLEKEALFTPLNYSDEYLNFIQENFNPNAHYTNAKDNLIPWCADESVCQKLVSKKTSALFNMNELKMKSIQLVQGAIELKRNHLYKRFHGFSGMGHLLSPRDDEKIQTLLTSGEELIEEPLYERVYDFSTLFLEGEVYRYQNIVDKSFHYKGSILRDFKLDEGLEDQYQREIKKIKNHYMNLGIRTPFSVDSFIYKENKSLKLKTLSEVNARKSMGYSAVMLAKKFNAKYSALILNRNEMDFDGRVKSYKLNPEGKIFNTYLCLSDNEKNLASLGFRLL